MMVFGLKKLKIIFIVYTHFIKPCEKCDDIDREISSNNFILFSSY